MHKTFYTEYLITKNKMKSCNLIYLNLINILCYIQLSLLIVIVIKNRVGTFFIWLLRSAHTYASEAT